MHQRTIAMAGIAAFAAVFAIGFVLGTIRTLAITPRIGPVNSVLIEVPLMLGASWAITRWAIQRWEVPPRVSARLMMGAIAFAFLMTAEAMLGRLAFDQSVGQWWAGLTSPAGAIGLFAQLSFALMPLAQRQLRGHDISG